MKLNNTNETTVIKLGGSLLDDAGMRESALRAIAAAWQMNQNLVVVHGGGKSVDAMLRRLGIAKQTAGGLRVTDSETLPVVVAVLSGVVNKQLVGELHRYGVASTGISGADGETVMASLHPSIDGVELGAVGMVSDVNPELINTILAVGFLPLIASIAMHPDGSLLNVNADAVASAVAAKLGAKRLVFMTDVEGVHDASGTVVERMETKRVSALLASPVISGGMRPKLQSVLDALKAGVSEVVIAGPGRHSTVLIDGKGGTHLVAA